MKTHAVAAVLRTLANVFESGPNTELSQVCINEKSLSSASNKELVISLQTLFSLSKISKKQWTELIGELGFKISVAQRDSSRNILGKILTYLENTPEAVKALKQRARDSRKTQSNLMEALGILLGDS